MVPLLTGIVLAIAYRMIIIAEKEEEPKVETASLSLIILTIIFFILFWVTMKIVAAETETWLLYEIMK